jgi:hypothetical protein
MFTPIIAVQPRLCLDANLSHQYHHQSQAELVSPLLFAHPSQCHPLTQAEPVNPLLFAHPSQCHPSTQAELINPLLFAHPPNQRHHQMPSLFAHPNQLPRSQM